MWKYVISHFESFLNELELSTATRIDGEAKAERVARSLRRVSTTLRHSETKFNEYFGLSLAVC